MKSLRALKAAGLILAAVVLGLMTVQGSYALWNTAVTANAGTVQAADFSVKVEDNMLSPNQDFQLPAAKLSMASQELITRVSVTTISNVTDTSPFRTSTTATVNPVSVGSPLVVTVAIATNRVCPTEAKAYKNSVVISDQKAKAEHFLCFRTALKEGTTNEMLGGTANASATLDVTQVAPK